MKKRIIVLVLVIFSFSLWGKSKTPIVTEHTWGLEISNIDSDGNPICENSFYITNKTKQKFTINYKYLTRDDTYTDDSLFEEYFNNTLNNRKIQFSDVTLVVDMKNCTKVLIVFTDDTEIVSYKANIKKGNLCLEVLEIKPNFALYFKERVRQEKIARENAEKERIEAEKIAEQEKIKQKQEERKRIYEESGYEGYDSMPWGTILKEVSEQYPTAKIENVDNNIKTLSRKGSKSNVTLTYYFYNDQLYKGETIYINTDQDTLDALQKKLEQLYGSKYEKKDINEKGKTTFSYYQKQLRYEYGLYNEYELWKHIGWSEIWKKSTTFKLEFKLINTYTADYEYQDYRCTENSLSLIYENPKVISELESVQKKQKEEEMKKKMDNLDL